MEISELTKKIIEELLKEGRRFDGRKLNELREVKIETDISKNAEGSAKVKIGDTEVVVGVKLNVGEPYPDSQDAGTMMVAAELSPLASENFESGPPQIEAIELARLVDRAIRESEYIDFKKLCVRKGELVWNVFIDIYPMNVDGNLIDASTLAAVIALSRAVFPVLEDDKVKYGELTTKKLPLNNAPITITSYKINNSFILDPTTAEEESSSCRISVALTSQKEIKIHALQKSGYDALTEEEIDEVVSLAVNEHKKLYNMCSQFFKK